MRQTKGELREEIEQMRKTSLDSTSSTLQDEEATACIQHLLSWRSCVPRGSTLFAMAKEASEPFGMSSLLSFPPLPIDTYSSKSQTNTWTRTGWSTTHIRHLLDAIFTWEHLAVCLLCKDLFILDFEGGSTQFCSASLVHAMLAIAFSLKTNDDIFLPCKGLRSRLFYDEAKSCLKSLTKPRDLPNIQALGMLSLYEIRCGREEQAMETAEKFFSAMANLCHSQVQMTEQSDQYTRARTTSYNGALLLVRYAIITAKESGGVLIRSHSTDCGIYRMLQLVTGKVFTDPELFDDQIPGLDRPPRGSPAKAKKSEHGTMPMEPLCEELDRPETQANGAYITETPGLLFENHQNVAANLFQITEWVHKMIATTIMSTASAASTDVMGTYYKFLNWYGTIFSVHSAHGGRTPFALFMQYVLAILKSLSWTEELN